MPSFLPETAENAAPVSGHAATAPFLRSATLAGAVAFALGQGWVDRLLRGPLSPGTLLGSTVTPQGGDLLLMLLDEGGVLVRDSLGRLGLTPAFRRALAVRDLLEAQLWFTRLAAADLGAGLADFLTDPGAFRARSAVFGLFRYDRGLALTPDNIAATRPWVHHTSVLTRHEAGAALDRLDLTGVRRMLDVGGNSGAFAAAACARAPDLQAEVFDLPVVCAIGHEMLAGQPQAARIRFRPGDLRSGRLEGVEAGLDLVSFKSVLHDWPLDQALDFLAMGARRLAPGGRIVIYERCAMTPQSCPDLLDYGAQANMVFQPFYRDPDIYRARLAGLGLRERSCHRLRLDMDFMLIEAEVGTDVGTGARTEASTGASTGIGTGADPRATPRRARMHAVPSDFPGDEIGATGRALLDRVQALDRPFGYEHSAKFSATGINADRFVVSMTRADFAGPRMSSEAGFARFAAGLGADPTRLAALLERLGQARVVHFGHEGGRHPVRKIYLEFVDDLLAARGRGDSAPVLIFEALKWRLDAPQAARLDRYWLPLDEADPLAALARWDRDGRPHPAAAFARAVAGDAPADRLTRFDVAEVGGARDSFDLNLYRLARSLDAAGGPLAALAGAFGLPDGAIAPILAGYGPTRLGHVAGGRASDGRAFATVYYGLQGRHGPDPAPMLIHAPENTP